MILLLENQDDMTRLNESGVTSQTFNKYLRPHDKESDTYFTEALNFLNNTPPTTICRVNDLYEILKTKTKTREAISADSFNNEQLPST